METKKWRHGRAGILIAVGFVALLWSWNTLADLFGWPGAEARHVLAAVLLLGTIRAGLTEQPGRHGLTTRRRPDAR